MSVISKVNNGQHKSHWRLHDENRISKSNPWSECHGNECPCQRNGSRRRNLTIKSHHNHQPSWKIMLQGWKPSCGRIMGSSPLHCGYPKWLQSMIYQVPMLLARDIFPMPLWDLRTRMTPFSWLGPPPFNLRNTKENCHLFSLWIIIHMDTKLLTTLCKHTMFLSLFRANVPSVSTRNTISTTCTQNKNYMITR